MLPVYFSFCLFGGALPLENFYFAYLNVSLCSFMASGFLFFFFSSDILPHSVIRKLFCFAVILYLVLYSIWDLFWCLLKGRNQTLFSWIGPPCPWGTYWTLVFSVIWNDTFFIYCDSDVDMWLCFRVSCSIPLISPSTWFSCCDTDIVVCFSICCEECL